MSSKMSDYTEEQQERRRVYQRRYYQLNKEKAKAYQKEYNRHHKKKSYRTEGSYKVPLAERPVIRECFTASDLMHMPAEKSLKALQQIINYERYFTI